MIWEVCVHMALDRGRIWVGLLPNLVDDGAHLGVGLGHELAQVVVCEEVAPLALDPGEDVLLAKDAPLDQVLAERHQWIGLGQVECDVGGGGVAVEPRQGVNVEDASSLLVTAVRGRPPHGSVRVEEVAAVAAEVLQAKALGIGLEVDDTAPPLRAGC